MNIQPKISVPVSTIERILDFFSVVFLISMFGYLLFKWPSLPDTIATHFDASNKADGWGSKGVIWSLPITALLLFIGLTALAKFPHIFNYPSRVTEENAPKFYILGRQMMKWLNCEIMFILLIFVWDFIQSAQGANGLGIWFLPIALILLFGTIIIYLIKFSKAK